MPCPSLRKSKFLWTRCPWDTLQFCCWCFWKAEVDGVHDGVNHDDTVNLSKGRAANSASVVSVFQGIISTWNQNGLSFTCLPSSTDLVIMTPPLWWLNVFKIFFQFCESGKIFAEENTFYNFNKHVSEFFLKKVSQILHHLWQEKQWPYGEASSALGIRRGICLAGLPSRSDPWWHYRAWKQGQLIPGPGVQGSNSWEPIWTHLKQIEPLSWTLACIFVLQIMSSFFWLKPIDFSSEMVLCKFSLNLSLFGLGPSSKGHASNFWLSANMIVLFHWTLDLRPEAKVALSLHSGGYICRWNSLGSATFQR